jgi:hypothetical protein
MSELLDHLSRDTLPPELLDSFVNWCVWEQAHPALLTILQKTGLYEQADHLQTAKTFAMLAQISEKAGNDVHEARKSTGPLGLSTAEAASFLVSRMAKAATEAEWDPEGVAFFAAQVCGWAGFAEVGFNDFNRKTIAEQIARQTQEDQLSGLWRQFAVGENS